MSYLLQEPTEFINIKLTDAGRNYLAKGELTFDSVALSDREINYGFARNQYNICQNYVLGPKDDNPTFAAVNFDGTAAYTLNNITAYRRIITGLTESLGVFTGATNNFTIDSSNNCLGVNEIHYSAATPAGTSTITLGGTAFTPDEGQLVYIPWQPIQNSGVTNNTSAILSGNPINGLWYRVLDASGYPDVILDRPTPNFSAGTANTVVPTFFFPWNGVEDFYGSASTQETKVWNMNIVRTSSEIGTNSTLSGYTSYGSIEYNGTKHYLGFSSETRAIGVIHYTNQFTGNTYAEQLVEKSVQLDLPTIMWHKTSSTQPGQANTTGLHLTDNASDNSSPELKATTQYDSVAGTTYRHLVDGSDYSVGRVYHKLKIIVITDPELLIAMSYKSNRSYTLPNFTVDKTYAPTYPLVSGTSASGLIESGKTYFVTYLTESDYAYANGQSYGYPQAMPCGYIQSYLGVDSSNGDKAFLKFSFNGNKFPFLRQSADMTGGTAVVTGGTGWSTNKLQLLVNIANNSTNPMIDTIPAENWKLISTGVGNGIFTGSSQAITASELEGLTMIISQEDYTSGSTFVLNGQFSAFTQNPDVNLNGLTFGSESFFFGNIQTGIKATTFKTIITVLAEDTLLNSSTNLSFDGSLDTSTFVTEAGVFKDDPALGNVLVAVGKMSYPIEKNNTRYLLFQLEVDF